MINDRGQGLLEMTVAIGILVTGVVGALSLTSGSVSASTEARARTAATGLAREGIEAVRSIRDSNWLAARPWDDGLEGPMGDRSGVPALNPTTGVWTVEFAANSLSDAEAAVVRGGEGAPPELFRQGAAGERTLYRRLVSFFPICWNETAESERVLAPPETECAAQEQEAGAEARSAVSWTVGGRPHAVEIIERIYDWR